VKLVTSSEMREIDRKTIEDFGVPGEALMDRAGTGVAEIVRFLARISGCVDSPVHLIAGRGNNGGDAFVAARYLKRDDFEVDVWLAGEAAAIRGDALSHLNKMKSEGIQLSELPTTRDWDVVLASSHANGGIVVDGVLGTGIGGPARGPASGAIRFVNALADRSLIVAVDVPSGLNADTGEAEGDAVKADVTATMGLPKRGLAEPCAVEYVGSVEVVDIGIPDELVSRSPHEKELIAAEDLRRLVGRRRRTAHKGVFGSVLIIGGAGHYTGAVAMAAGAAVRSGTGLVTALVPARIAPIVAAIVPEAMVHACAETTEGSLSADSLAKWPGKLEEFDAVLIGPGMSLHEESRHLVEQVLAQCRAVLVMDADALNACAGRLHLIEKAACPVIVTPHPGEMARLLNCSISDVQADRHAVAGRIAEETGVIAVLKGAGTVVAARGRPLNINITGNPGMATGGMGDVLAGLIAGLAAQGFEPFDAARMGVYLHGRAGDNVAWATSQGGMTAGDVIHELPHVFKDVAVR